MSCSIQIKKIPRKIDSQETFQRVAEQGIDISNLHTIEDKLLAERHFKQQQIKRKDLRSLSARVCSRIMPYAKSIVACAAM